MAAVIRSVKTSKEPVLLRRNVPIEAVLASAFAAPRVHREGELFAAPVAAAALKPQVAQLSYEEYEQRFAAELDARRAEAREKGMAEGREKGIAEGREAGLAQAASEQAAQLKALAAVVHSARERVNQGIEGLSDLGVEIVFESVCKVLGQALAGKEGVIAAVREAVRHTRDRSRLTLRVSPADAKVIQENLERILEGLEPGQVEVLADDRVTLGGCLLETPSGNLDGRLEVQLANLRRTLLAARSGASDGDAPA